MLPIVALFPLFRLIEVRFGRRVAVAAVAAVSGLAAIATVGNAGVMWPLIAAGALNVGAAGYGRTLASRLRLDTALCARTALPLWMALGWTALICAGLFLGTVGLLTGTAVAALVAVGVALVLVPGVADPRRVEATSHHPAASDRGVPAAWWWGLAVLLLIGFVEAIAPETRHDALAAHLPIAREIAAHGAILRMPENAASYFQLNADVAYAMAFTLGPGAALPKLLHFVAGAAATVLVFDLGARMWGPRAGLLAAMLLAGTSLVWWLGGTAYTDLWGMLFASGALWVTHVHGGALAPPRALAAGLLAGAALGTKMPTAAVVTPLVAVILTRILRTTADRERRGAVSMLAAGLVAAGAYWYARAWVLLGNPVHPLFRHWVDPDARPSALSRLYGMGHSIVDLLALPWRVTWHPERFVEVGSIGPGYLLLLPVVLIAISRGRIPRWLAATFIAAGLIWFATSQYLRFFVPALPIAALLCGGGVAALGGRAREIWTALALVTVAVSAAAWTDRGDWQDALRVARGSLHPVDYLARHVPGYRVAEFAARTLPDDARIAGLGEELGFYYGRVLWSASWRGRRYDRELGARLRRLSSGTQVQALLASRGFTHLVVVPDAFASPRVGPPRRTDGWVVREALWEEGPRLLAADGSRYLFRLDAPASHRPGPILADTDGATVSVKSGALYVLEAEVRSDQEGVRAELGLEWRDASGQVLVAPPKRSVGAAGEWRRAAMAASAPTTAVAVTLSVRATDVQRLEVRRVQLYELR